MAELTRWQIVDLLNIRVDLSRSSGALGMAETARSRQYTVSSCRQQPGTKGVTADVSIDLATEGAFYTASYPWVAPSATQASSTRLLDSDLWYSLSWKSGTQ